MKLSKRLSCIADTIMQVATTKDIFADIGTDHGYLPCFLVENKVLSFAYACDVAVGPYSSSKETIALYHLEDQVIPLLGNGLEPVLHLQPTIICLAGMGGFLIEDILLAHLSEMESIQYIVIQANIGQSVVRKYLTTNGFQIMDERMVKDAHHIYEVMLFARGMQNLSSMELEFGPVLLQEKPALFIEKWEYELSIQYRILESLTPEMPRFHEVNEMIDKIKEVLYED